MSITMISYWQGVPITDLSETDLREAVSWQEKQYVAATTDLRASVLSGVKMNSSLGDYAAARQMKRDTDRLRCEAFERASAGLDALRNEIKRRGLS